MRICKALDEPPKLLAKNIGVPYAELHPLLDPLHLLVELDRDETWWLISQYVDKRIGVLLAARAELNKALQKDRSRRAVRVQAMQQRQGKGSPRARLKENNSD